MSTSDLDHDAHKTTYDLPFVMPFLRRYKCFSYIPFLPTFKFESKSIFQKWCKSTKRKKSNDSEVYTGIPNLNANDRIEQTTCNFQLDISKNKIELLSSLWRQRQRLGRLSFRLRFRLSFCQSPFLKNYQRYPFETWNTCSLSKEEPITTRQVTL